METKCVCGRELVYCPEANPFSNSDYACPHCHHLQERGLQYNAYMTMDVAKAITKLMATYKKVITIAIKEVESYANNK